MVGTVASMYNTPAVIIAMGSTLAISVGVIAFSAQVGSPICSQMHLITTIICTFVPKVGLGSIQIQFNVPFRNYYQKYVICSPIMIRIRCPW